MLEIKLNMYAFRYYPLSISMPTSRCTPFSQQSGSIQLKMGQARLVSISLKYFARVALKVQLGIETNVRQVKIEVETEGTTYVVHMHVSKFCQQRGRDGHYFLVRN